MKISQDSFSRQGLTAVDVFFVVLFEVDAVDQLEGVHRIHIPALIVLRCHQLYPLNEQRIKEKNEDRKNNQPPILANHYQTLCIHAQACREYTRNLQAEKQTYNAFTLLKDRRFLLLIDSF